MTDAASTWDDAPLRALLTEQSDLLLTRISALDDTAAREQSLLPGWSRGHVLTHLARNADSLANSAAGALLERPLPRYLSPQQRDQDIEAGSRRPADQLVADLRTSSGRMLALLAAVATTPPDVRQPDGRGGTVRIGDGRHVVHGSGAEVLAWLTGRSDGHGLTTPLAALPALGSWG